MLLTFPLAGSLARTLDSPRRWERGAGISCAYPLDDAGSTLGGLGFGAIDTTADPNRQVGELTITAAGANKYFALRDPADIPAAMPGSGVVGYELDLLSVPRAVGMTGALRPALATAYLTAANVAAQLVVVYAEVTSAATFDVLAVSLLPGGFGSVTVATGLPVASILTTRIGTYVDQATGDLGVLVNAADSGYLGLVPPGTWAKLSPGLGIDNDATGLDGTVFRAGFVSSAEAMTLPNWPSGTVTLCGDTI